MITFLNKFKLFLKKILGFFPSPTPVGMTEFDAWAKDILTTYGWPDNDSFRFALASMVINLPPTTKYRSKAYFSRVVHSAAAKQIAGEWFRTLKEKQQAEAKAAKLAEVPALAAVASNDHPG